MIYSYIDSGFCVIKGIEEMYHRGVFGASLINNCQYWPLGVPGDAIDAHFDSMEVGDSDDPRVDRDGVPVKIYGMKEPEYIMKIMSTYGTLQLPDNQRAQTRWTFKVQGKNLTKEFTYPSPFFHHYQGRHSVDDHNGHRHAPISLEETCGTIWWSHHNFSWLLSVTEVNINLTYSYFSKKNIMVQIQF